MAEDVKTAMAQDPIGPDGQPRPNFIKPRPAHVLDQAPGEVAGPKGPEPTRYGDWERKGIVSDF